jgi:hypothetical protein
VLLIEFFTPRRLYFAVDAAFVLCFAGNRWAANSHQNRKSELHE